MVDLPFSESTIMSKNILVVEDNDDQLEMMAVYLQHLGYQVLKAADGFQALAYIYHREPPDLILMDISMPDLDGIETIKHIRDASKASIPIICITAYASLYRDRAMAAGCADFLAKPFDFETLTQVIELHISGSDEKLAPAVNRDLNI